jgi:glycosyltransferase involved in cell wall biosynthesis/Flp pilus assembly protein TadD
MLASVGFERERPLGVARDTVGAETLDRGGMNHVRAANVFGARKSFLEHPPADTPRDIDILFAGNLNSSVQQQRMPWLARLARLGDRWRVRIETGVFGEAYRALLCRARVVFNHSLRGECNLFEAAAAGALLLTEANRELPTDFRDRHEYLAFTSENLESLLDYYLTHEEERKAMADSARSLVGRFSFEALWEGMLGQIDVQWPQLLRQLQECRPFSRYEWLMGRTWQLLSSSFGADPALENDLASALASQPRCAAWHNALGLVTAMSRPARDAALAKCVAGYFERAWQCDPTFVPAGLNLAQALADAGQSQAAIEQARRALDVLDHEPSLSAHCWDAPRYPSRFDLFRVEWERAAWAHAGNVAAQTQAKKELLRWELNFLLADLTNEPRHYYEAALARPDLSTSRAALGCALARHGHVQPAVNHLQHAATADPLDLGAARALYQALGETNQPQRQRRLARDRYLLSLAAPQTVPMEHWFKEAPPVGDELVSIVVLCGNGLDYTRLCLESVLRHTRRPYELLVVDNASSDGTAGYLEDLRGRTEPWRVVILGNDTKLGAPAGRNQALALAKGLFAVFLDNDTVVTANWLDRLVACALCDWPHVAAVGAVTNYTAPPQQIPVPYLDQAGLDAFAERRRDEFGGKAQQCARLTSFCQLVRRDVLQQLGGFDERLDLGYLEDDDLSLRIVNAGYRLLIALDVFVHHFGHRTFGAAEHCQERFHRSLKVFRDKWGVERTAALFPHGSDTPLARPPHVFEPPAFARPPAPAAKPGHRPSARDAIQEAPPQSVAAPRTARVSLCMIVKNEEHNLPDCLASVGDLFDEVVVVDTGSTDRTKAVAKRLAARVIDFSWVDSFAAARNESLRYATGDWVFWLDADDRLDDENCDKLRSLFTGLSDENTAFVMHCLCLPDPDSRTATAVHHVRLFRRLPDLQWRYRVHEQILPSLREHGVTVRWSNVVIHHTGYQDPALRERKLERDLRLLRMEDAERPDEPFTLFNLGSVYQELGRYDEALPLLRRSLERSQPSDSIVRKLYALLVQAHRHLRQRSEALTVCRAGRHYFPDDVELLFHEGVLLREQGDRRAAEACLLRILELPPPEYFASVDTGLRGYKTRHNLAVLYVEEGRHAEAEAQWKAALEEEPGFAPALIGLGDLYLAQTYWSKLETICQRLGALPETAIEAEILRARGSLQRREFPRARQVLEETIERYPQATWPRVILSHVLLQEGRDWTAAEMVLRSILTLEPHNKEARHNLGLLLERQGKVVDV